MNCIQIYYLLLTSAKKCFFLAIDTISIASNKIKQIVKGLV